MKGLLIKGLDIWLVKKQLYSGIVCLLLPPCCTKGVRWADLKMDYADLYRAICFN
jgi:hypothetical protein